MTWDRSRNRGPRFVDKVFLYKINEDVMNKL